MLLRIVKLSANAKIPTKGSSSAAGYDLYSAYDYDVPQMGKVLAKTDIQIHVWRSIAQMLLRHKTPKQTNQIHMPSGYYGRVTPCSGLAAKHFIDVGAGVIDEDYSGNLGVVLFNFGKESFKACKGDRIAQLICERIYPEIVEAEKLDDTDRGGGGFGSTGKTAFSKT